MNAMETRGLDILIDQYDFPESSQIDAEISAMERPTAPSPSTSQPPYEECSGREYEDNDTKDRTLENVPSEDPLTTVEASLASRVLRKRTPKQRPAQPGSPTSSQALTSKSRKRIRERSEDEATQPKRRGRKPTSTTEIKRFETITSGLLEDFKSKVYSLEKNKADIQELHLQINSLKTDLKQAQQCQREIEASLSSKNAQLYNECSKLRRKLEAAIDAAQEDSGRYFKISDSDIAAEWGKISFNIRGLVSQFLTETHMDECDLLEALMKGLGIPLPLSSYDYSDLRNDILRRAIWEIIIHGVFSGDLPIWHGEPGQMLTQLVTDEGLEHLDNPIYLKMISCMKISAISHLKEETPIDEDVIKELVLYAAHTLDKFINISNTENFHTMMKNLIKDAVDLHTVMMKSKAIFLLRWFGDGGGENVPLYDSNSMELLQDDADTSLDVEFVQTPALVKYGNADGEGFEFNMILCKASVILEEREVGTDGNESREMSCGTSGVEESDTERESSSDTEE